MAIQLTIGLKSSRTHEPEAASDPVAVSLQNVSKRFGRGNDTLLALDGISLDVRAGEFLCLVGASGCGKSTILNLIAGLDSPTAGSVRVQGTRTALLFQEAALFPWLTVEENVEFPMRTRGVPRARRRESAAALLDTVHLTGFGHRRPHELSGGMRQRAALARALAQEAEVLLMDEPFGALDAMIRDLLDDEIERIWRDAGLTIVFVTHDVREAARLGDRVVLLSSRPGRIASEFAVDIERPRRNDSAEVAALATTITQQLAHEARRHAAL